MINVEKIVLTIFPIGGNDAHCLNRVALSMAFLANLRSLAVTILYNVAMVTLMFATDIFIVI